MGFSLAELRKGVPGSGIDAPPGIDVLALLGDAIATGDARAAVQSLRAGGGHRRGLGRLLHRDDQALAERTERLGRISSHR